MTRARCLLAALLVVIPMLMVPAGPALACSCDYATTTAQLKAALRRVDGAFVGVLVGQDFLAPGEVRSTDREMAAVHHFEVERAVKGGIGERVEVLAPGSGGSCGLELSVGERSGLLLGRGIIAWESSMCGATDPDALLAVATDESDPSPAPPFSSDVRLVLVTGVVLLAIALGLAAVSYRRRPPGARR